MSESVGPPNYTISSDIQRSCSSCRSYDRATSTCTRYNVPVDSSGVCDAFDSVIPDLRSIGKSASASGTSGSSGSKGDLFALLQFARRGGRLIHPPRNVAPFAYTSIIPGAYLLLDPLAQWVASYNRAQNGGMQKSAWLKLPRIRLSRLFRRAERPTHLEVTTHGTEGSRPRILSVSLGDISRVRRSVASAISRGLREGNFIQGVREWLFPDIQGRVLGRGWRRVNLDNLGDVVHRAVGDRVRVVVGDNGILQITVPEGAPTRVVHNAAAANQWFRENRVAVRGLEPGRTVINLATDTSRPNANASTRTRGRSSGSVQATEVMQPAETTGGQGGRGRTSSGSSGSVGETGAVTSDLPTSIEIRLPYQYSTLGQFLVGLTSPSNLIYQPTAIATTAAANLPAYLIRRLTGNLPEHYRGFGGFLGYLGEGTPGRVTGGAVSWPLAVMTYPLRLTAPGVLSDLIRTGMGVYSGRGPAAFGSTPEGRRTSSLLNFAVPGVYFGLQGYLGDPEENEFAAVARGRLPRNFGLSTLNPVRYSAERARQLYEMTARGGPIAVARHAADATVEGVRALLNYIGQRSRNAGGFNTETNSGLSSAQRPYQSFIRNVLSRGASSDNLTAFANDVNDASGPFWSLFDQAYDPNTPADNRQQVLNSVDAYRNALYQARYQAVRDLAWHELVHGRDSSQYQQALMRIRSIPTPLTVAHDNAVSLLNQAYHFRRAGDNATAAALGAQARSWIDRYNRELQYLNQMRGASGGSGPFRDWVRREAESLPDYEAYRLRVQADIENVSDEDFTNDPIGSWIRVMSGQSHMGVASSNSERYREIVSRYNNDPFGIGIQYDRQPPQDGAALSDQDRSQLQQQVSERYDSINQHAQRLDQIDAALRDPNTPQDQRMRLMREKNEITNNLRQLQSNLGSDLLRLATDNIANVTGVPVDPSAVRSAASSGNPRDPSAAPGIDTLSRQTGPGGGPIGTAAATALWPRLTPEQRLMLMAGMGISIVGLLTALSDEDNTLPGVGMVLGGLLLSGGALSGWDITKWLDPVQRAQMLRQVGLAPASAPAPTPTTP